MNRRNSLKAIIAATGGIIALPGWAHQWARETVPRALGAFNEFEQGMIRAVADTIIPQGKDIGALSVGVDKFLIGLLENCYEAEVRNNVKQNLAALNVKAQAAGQKDFAQNDLAQRETLLLSLAESSDKGEKDFFDLMKLETIRGFSTSKEVMLGYLKYKVVPGHYYGCTDATS